MKRIQIIPPIAKVIPKKLEIHGDERIDNYYWLNDKNNPEVIDYLNAENEYFNLKTAHTDQFQKLLFKEMKSRIKEDDESVPYKKNRFFYTTRFEKGKQYPIYSRKKGGLTSEEEILFDVNVMAKDFSYYKLTGVSVSPNNNLVAFAVDTVSRRQYTIQFKNIETGELFPEKIKNTTGGATWANDNSTIFYTRKDETTLRSDKVFRHILGTNPIEDVEVFNEDDDTFNCYVYKTKTEKYIVIGSYSTVSNEYRLVEADNPFNEFKIFQPRERDLEYSLAHYNGHFYILTNKDGASNFKLMKTDENKTLKENWNDLIPHRDDVLLEDLIIFKDFAVLEERINGLVKIRIIRWDDSEDFYLPFDEETYTAGVHYNPEFNSTKLRYSYISMTTPGSVIEYDINSKKNEILKVQKVLGGKFKKTNYKSERLWATANDGTKIPISLVYHINTKLTKNTPLLLYGYGSYGHTIDASFSSSRLSLLDRGFVYAIAHVRGSEYLGRKWYETGKLFHKKNTFTDFVNCAQFLIKQKYTSAKHLYAYGGSAGGLLMGVIINTNPNLFNGVIASVPFVDVVTTMLDESIPLTTGEYDEWGNPNQKDYYHYIKSYSPYDNVKEQKHPHLFVSTGLHDSQVQYFEPAKWVAKLRVNKQDKNILIMYTDMETGHGGASGRFDSLKEVARDYSFLLDLEGKAIV
ncbi:S9 family peptidase [Lutibacter sp.]|uniref:S9 family peptidase n=1 Tax=Lutibacter sp. TaxID=1925666 RepID=UPI00273452ED|nr:S9 family peptidase [Lutibacter sp.]MDP3312418.1 S9 family peptidase [Lutibacter sp.]